MEQFKYLVQSLLNLGLNLILFGFFYILLSPIAFILRLLKFDLAKQNYQEETDSYWLKRTNSLVDEKYMRSQR